MENKDLDSTKKRRRPREKSVKKWTEKEICVILDYIQEAGNFEKPTAQIFYRKLLEQQPLDASWDLIRWKMRSLKTSFTKATEWSKTTGAGLLEAEKGLGTVQAKILKICPYYDRLKEIFGDRTEGRSSFATYELPEFIISDEEEPEELRYEVIELNDQQSSNDLNIGIEYDPSPYEVPTEPQPTPVTPTARQNYTSDTVRLSEPLKCAEKLRKFAPKTAIGQLSQLHAERQAFQEKKLKFENERLTQSAEIEEKKLNLEREKAQKLIAIEERKLQLEEKKIENDFELRKLQIEKEERIAMREMELKYKNN